MLLKEYGFRPVYHNVCAFELNDKLRDLVKACPDIDKSSHAVCYGYIDAKKGLMLEVLCGGKQATKYFYFKDLYEGERITISASNLKNVEFDFFPNLEPRFRKKLNPRIEPLKKYDAPEELEKTRSEELGFLDAFRDLQHPDVVRVIFRKNGLEDEEVQVHLTGTGDHCMIGTVQKNPKQDFGYQKGDEVRFNARQLEDKRIEIYVDLNEEHELTKEDLENGSFLKQCIGEFLKDTENKNAFDRLVTVMRSSGVVVPCDVHLSDEAAAIMEKLQKEGKKLEDLEGDDAETFQAGVEFFPRILENDGHGFLPVFTSEAEIGKKQLQDAARVNMPFLHAIGMAKDSNENLEGIVVNAFTDNFILRKDLYDEICSRKPIFEEGDEESLNEGDIQNFTNHEELKLAVLVDKMAAFNYALYQNRVNPIQGIRIINDTGNPITGLSLRITSDLDVFKPYETALPSIPSGKPFSLPDPHLKVNGKELAAMTDVVNALVTVELVQEGETVCGVRGHMMVLAYDQWMGGIGYRYLLPAFVIPTHPVIPAIMHDTAERLAKWGKSSALEGYQEHDPNRVRDIAAAAYAAIQKKNIVYANPPVSFFSAAGQQIRTPETIMEQRLGTCMDMTLLYAALLEGIGLHPLLVLMDGHIFAGVWLKERTSEELKASNVIIDDVEQLTMRINNGSDELTFVECTAMCADRQMSFEEAEAAAKQGNLNPSTFEMAIDVFLSRCHGIHPIPPRMKEGDTYQLEISDKNENELTDAPTDLGLTISEVVDVKPRKITNKRELWESKLLDLSTHNMLLNLPLNSSVEPIMSSHIDELEDALSDGHEFNLLPVAEWIENLSYTRLDANGKPGKPVQWLPEALKNYGIYEMTDWPVSADFDFNERFRQEYRNHRLYTYCTAKQLDRELTTIYRAARASQQENGVSSLYLAIGLLRWFEESDSKEPCYAPLILIPIEIVRKSANQGYALHARADEPHFNATLLEMLKQNFNINIGGLDPLPSDEHGIDIKKVFAIVRNSLFTVKNWDVVETCVIGNFSFAQFAMWNDIHTAGDMLESSNVVRSLMKGHVDWDVKAADNLEEEKTYLPITVDATQLQAIKMAAHGTTFVLHGPPGTGKSQTITGMIANLMAQGKRVLFVAEKMAALSVVQKRLASLGIGDFCLELHSDKANKKQVLTQLNKALSVQHPLRKTEYEEYQNKIRQSGEKIDGYAEHLHHTQNCGYSLRELIALYEMVRDEETSIAFDWNKVGKLTKSDIKAHLPLIDRLTAAGDVVDGGIAGNPLLGVGLTSYSAEVRGQLHQSAQRYAEQLSAVKEAGSRVATAFAMNAPENMQDIRMLEGLIALYSDYRNENPLTQKLLSNPTDKVYRYFDRMNEVDDDREHLLEDWQEEFLELDMEELLAKHTAAGKKFLGKSSAMAHVTAEIQVYAKKNLSYETIPLMLRCVANYQQMEQDLEQCYETMPEDLQLLLRTYVTKEEYEKAYAAAKAANAQTEKFPGGMEAIRQLAADPANDILFAELTTRIDQMETAGKEFNTLLQRADHTEQGNWLEEEINFCNYVMEHPAALKDWGLYNQVRQECIKVGLEPVVDAYEQGKKAESLIGAYRKGLYYALISNVIVQDDVLSCFSGATFNESIAQFKKLDDLLLEQAREEIYYLLSSRVPTSWTDATTGLEMTILRKAIGSNARGMSIRELFERIPHILPRLTPCMLMSPNSVAQYLSQKNDLFDVVIFDEASQLPTCRAVGALARAKDAVIVGDPKQMPPTSFFSGAGPEVDDLALDDLDSILDDALALGIPSQHLQWHYRSMHESLIAFSNNEFYENKMYTFPSANDRERHVTAVHVEGVYSKSTNIKEAEAVVQEIVRRFLDPELRNQSIGVVTFNVKQQTLIENLLAKQFQNNAELDAWANGGEDPIFVKNLENVQGDERDVILFSIGYGPDEKGHISMNFGPINKTGGGKRLNVAFSRARMTMTIFASLYSSDIKVTENSPEGLIAFRDFLKFAEGQDIRTEASSEASAKLARAGILQSICKAVSDHGYQCTTMVGHSDFHVDIAVLDPFVPTKYMLGILLDGDGYRQTKNTRDREVAQISVLKKLGWSLTRVWTIDWWDNREKVINKLLGKLDALKAEAEKKMEEAKATEGAQKAEESVREAETIRVRKELETQVAEIIAEDEEAEKEMQIAERPAADAPMTQATSAADPNGDDSGEGVSDRDDLKGDKSGRDVSDRAGQDGNDSSRELEPVPYVKASIEMTPISSAEFAKPENKAAIAERIRIIVDTEAPILKEEVIREVFASYNVAKGKAAEEAFEKAFKAAKVKVTKTKGILFCWSDMQDPKTWRGIRVSNERSGDEISVQEISNAICYVLKRKGSLGKDELIKETSLLFGYKRLGKNLEAALTAGLQYARSSKMITAVSGNRFELAETENAG